jgi:L-ribulose-5-phosphate 3-epimerase
MLDQISNTLPTSLANRGRELLRQYGRRAGPRIRIVERQGDAGKPARAEETVYRKGLCQGNLRRDLDPRSAFERAAARGFHGIEVSLGGDGRVGLPPPYDVPARAAELARTTGLEIPSTMGPQFLDLFHLPLAEALPKIVERTHLGLAAARTLGATAALQIPGFVQVAWDPRSPIVPYDEAYDKSLAIYAALAPVAEQHGVTLCIENVWNRFLLSPLEMRSFVDAIGSPWVKVYFDVGNVLFSGFPEQWIRILGPRIGRIHLKDFRTAVGNLNAFVMLLEGDVNWQAVMTALRETGYQGYLTAEYGPYAHAPDALLDHLSASMDAIMGL